MCGPIVVVVAVVVVVVVVVIVALSFLATVNRVVIDGCD